MQSRHFAMRPSNYLNQVQTNHTNAYVVCVPIIHERHRRDPAVCWEVETDSVYTV
jgi:hypothetical protein